MDYSGLSDAQPTILASVQRCVYIFNVSSAERSSGIRVTRFRWQTNLLAFCDRLDRELGPSLDAACFALMGAPGLLFSDSQARPSMASAGRIGFGSTLGLGARDPRSWCTGLFRGATRTLRQVPLDSRA